MDLKAPVRGYCDSLLHKQDCGEETRWQIAPDRVALVVWPRREIASHTHETLILSLLITDGIAVSDYARDRN